MAGHISDLGSNDWNTPEYLLEYVRQFFGGTIGLDPCSNASSTVGAVTNFTFPEEDGLTQPWRSGGVRGTNVFVNPPYGPYYVKDSEILSAKEMKEKIKELEEGYGAAAAAVLKKQYKRFTMKDWTQAMVNAVENDGAVVVALIPCKPGTAPWQQHVFPHSNAICYIRGRPVFAGAKAGAPIDCCFVLFSPSFNSVPRFLEVFEKVGYVSVSSALSGPRPQNEEDRFPAQLTAGPVV